MTFGAENVVVLTASQLQLFAAVCRAALCGLTAKADDRGCLLVADDVTLKASCR